MDRDSRSYRALLLHPDGGEDDFVATLPVLGREPPILLRLSTTFAGMRAIDVYRLAESSAWPEAAAFIYEETVPGTIGDGLRVEQVSVPND